MPRPPSPIPIRRRVLRWVAERLIVWCARQLPYTVKTEREWMIVRPTKPVGQTFSRECLLGEVWEIPRDVLEAMGVDCSPVDRQGTVWLDLETSRKMHDHPLCQEYQQCAKGA